MIGLSLLVADYADRMAPHRRRPVFGRLLKPFPANARRRHFSIIQGVPVRYELVRYSRFVGDICLGRRGPPGLFLESTFLGLWIRLGPPLQGHPPGTICVVGMMPPAAWILAANDGCSTPWRPLQPWDGPRLSPDGVGGFLKLITWRLPVLISHVIIPATRRSSVAGIAIWWITVRPARR